jgi:hypothetical protein
VPVTLTNSTDAGGLNYFIATTTDDEGETGRTSNTLVLEYDPTAQPGTPLALIEVNVGTGITGSTYNNGSFTITNNSTGEVQIESIAFDLSSALLPDVVFDPVGNAGDVGGKCFTANSGASSVGLQTDGSGSGSGSCADPFSQPHDGDGDPSTDEGYDVMTLTFNDFDPGESFSFAVDVDPTTIKGDEGSGDAGSISGLETAGSTITVDVNDGSGATTVTTTLFSDGSGGGSLAYVKQSLLPAPTIAVQGVSPPATVGEAAQALTITGTPNTPVTLLQVDARLFIESSTPNGGFDIDPFEANEAMALQEYQATLDDNGTATIDVTLLQTDPGTSPVNAGPSGGLNHFLAVQMDGDGHPGLGSNTLVLEYAPGADQVSIAGTVTYYDGGENGGMPVEGAQLALSGDASKSATTDATGAFQLSAPSGQTYTLSASSSLPANEGVSTLDLALARQAILDINPLPSPYHEMAGDVNASGAVSTLDLVLTRQLILNLRSGFSDAVVGEVPAGRSALWQCAVTGLSETAFEASYSYDPLSEEQTGQDFHCFRLGDVNGSWQPDPQAALATTQKGGAKSARAQSASGPALRLTADDVEATVPAPARIGSAASSAASAPDEEAAPVVVPIRARRFEDVGGLQFTLEWDPEALTYSGIEGAALKGFSTGNLNAERTEEGRLAVAWDHPEAEGQSLADDAVIMKVRFWATGTPGQETAVTFGSALTAMGAHRVRGPDRALEAAAVTAEAASVQLTLRPERFGLGGTYPNPSPGPVTMTLDLPEAAEVRVTVYDLLGRQVMTTHETMAAGAGRSLSVDGSRLPSGLYFYRVMAKMASGTETDNGKMTLVK